MTSRGGVVCAVVTLLSLAATLYVADRSLPRNRCAMTFMHPTYRLIEILDERRQYALYRYAERGLSNDAAGAAVRVPVLFVPGNGGSFQQCRCVCSRARCARTRKFRFSDCICRM